MLTTIHICMLLYIYLFRLAYAIWMVEDLQKTLLEKPNLEIKVLYDISCMLVKHLQVSFASLISFPACM